jgi:hypothetical protein
MWHRRCNRCCFAPLRPRPSQLFHSKTDSTHAYSQAVLAAASLFWHRRHWPRWLHHLRRHLHLYLYWLVHFHVLDRRGHHHDHVYHQHCHVLRSLFLAQAMALLDLLLVHHFEANFDSDDDDSFDECWATAAALPTLANLTLDLAVSVPFYDVCQTASTFSI